MIKFNQNKKYIILLFCIFSCTNSPELNGRIAHYGSKFQLYHESMLELKISNKFTDRIYKIEWKIIPENFANLRYKKNKSNNRKYKLDRSAIIVPLKKGEFTIKVYAKDIKKNNLILIAENQFQVK